MKFSVRCYIIDLLWLFFIWMLLSLLFERIFYYSETKFICFVEREHSLRINGWVSLNISPYSYWTGCSLTFDLDEACRVGCYFNYDDDWIFWAIEPRISFYICSKWLTCTVIITLKAPFINLSFKFTIRSVW